MGMTGFDSVINAVVLLLFGMATVPDTHLLHTIDANSVSQRLGTVGRFAKSLATPQFDLSFAMAA